MRREYKAYIAAAAISAALHGGTIYNEPIRETARSFGQWASEKYEKYIVRQEREELIAKARNDLEEGRLELGRFVLAANALDAREEGRHLDLKSAMARYQGYLEALAKETAKGKTLKEAVPLVFSDIDYYGRPGGKMADAILEKAGSCEQISHLLASAAYDSGRKADAYLRSYAANSAGISHVAPILSENGEEFDMASGTQAMKRKDGSYAGFRMHAAELVEAYAKAHGLPAKQPEESLMCLSAPQPKKHSRHPDPALPQGEPSGFSYGGASDVFSEGTPPIFSKGAIKRYTGAELRAETGQNDTAEAAHEEKLVLKEINRMGADPFNSYWPVFGYPGTSRFAVPNPAKIEDLNNLFRLIGKVWDYTNAHDESEVKLLYLAKLAFLCEEAELKARLLEKYDLAKAAVAQRKKAIKLSDAIIDSITDSLDSMLGMFVGTRSLLPDQSISNLVYLGQKGQDLLFWHLVRRMDHVAVAGIINTGEALIISDGRVRLDGVEMRDGKPHGIISVLNRNGNLDSRLEITNEKVVNITRPSAKPVVLRAYYIGPSWADLAVLSDAAAGISGSKLAEVELLVALLARPATRERALELADRLPWSDVCKLCNYLSTAPDIELPSGRLAKAFDAYNSILDLINAAPLDFTTFLATAHKMASNYGIGVVEADYIVLWVLENRAPQPIQFWRDAQAWIDRLQPRQEETAWQSLKNDTYRVIQDNIELIELGSKIRRVEPTVQDKKDKASRTNRTGQNSALN